MSLNDELILNRVLSFIQSARDSICEKRIIDLTAAFFDPSEIYSSKQLIFNLVGKQFKERRSTATTPNTARSDSQDIFNLFEELEQNEIKLPTFVSPGYGSIPSGAGVDSIVGILGSLRDEIANLKFEISEIRKEREHDRKIYEDSAIVKEEIADIKKMILISNNGSGLTGRSGCAVSSLPSSPRRKKSRGVRTSISAPNVPVSPMSPCSPSSQHPVSFANKVKMGLPAKVYPVKTPTTNKSMFRGIKGTRSHVDNVNIGFRSAPRFSHIYVGGCDKSTSLDDVKEYCEKGGIKLVDIEKLKCKNVERSSFKIKVELGDKDKVLDSDFWLCGIIVRPFKLFKSS